MVLGKDGAWQAALLDAVREGLFVLDADGALVDMNGAFAELLGYGPEGMPYRPPMPWWPDPDDDPAEYAHVQRGHHAIKDGERGFWRVPLRHRDGHWVWVEGSTGTVEDGETGSGRRVFGILRDITAQHRARERDRLLSESGRLLTQPGPLTSRLEALTTAAAGVYGELVVLLRPGPDGALIPLAAAHPTDPGRAADALAAPPTNVPESAHDAHLAGRAYLDGDGGIVAPTSISERTFGALVVAPRADGRGFDRADLRLAEELARRIAGAVQTTRAANRERWLHEASAALAAALTVDEAARALGHALRDSLRASAVVVHARRPDEQDKLHLAHNLGYPAEFVERFRVIETGQNNLIDKVLRTGRTYWLSDRENWERHYRYAGRMGALTRVRAGFIVPLRLGREIVGVVGVAFDTEREFPEEERNYVQTLVSQAAQAFQRALLTDAHRDIARILQQRLLPQQLPEVPRLRLAAHYESAGEHNQAGGDWYDVIPLDGSRVGIVVGDVVGHGAPAAAIMGQLRAVLAGYLLEGHSPAEALGLLSRATALIDGSLASTAICLVLDTGTGRLRWSTAGHPPPLLVDPNDPARPVSYLSGARGGVLGAGVGGGFAVAYTDAEVVLPPGASVLLYTDGLVELGEQGLGAGLARLSSAVTVHRDADPEALLRAALAGSLQGARPQDDVALVVARLEPAHLDADRPGLDRPTPRPEPVAAHEQPAEPAGTEALRVYRHTDGGLTLYLAGALDLASVEPVAPVLARWLRATSGPVTVDVVDVSYLGSAGIRMLAEAVAIAGDRLRLRVEPGSAAANSLVLCGLELDGVVVTA
jgi:PAS domain S-box-containing protein